MISMAEEGLSKSNPQMLKTILGMDANVGTLVYNASATNDSIYTRFDMIPYLTLRLTQMSRAHFSIQFFFFNCVDF